MINAVIWKDAVQVQGHASQTRLGTDDRRWRWTGLTESQVLRQLVGE